MIVSAFSASLSVSAASTRTEPMGEKVLWANYDEIKMEKRFVETVRNGKNVSVVEKYPVITGNYGFAIYRTLVSESKTEYTYFLEAETLKNGNQTKYYKSAVLTIEKKNWDNLAEVLKKDKRLRKISIPKEASELQATIKLYNTYNGYLEAQNDKTMIRELLSSYCDIKISGLTNELTETLKEQANMSVATEDALKDIFKLSHPAKDMSDEATSLLEMFENKIYGTTISIVDYLLNYFKVYSVAVLDELIDSDAIIIDYEKLEESTNALKNEIGKKSKATYEDIYRILG